VYCVYAIYNKENKKIYIGQTENLEERLKLHNNKVFKNSYTSRFSGEWTLIYREFFQTRQEVLRREKQLKSFKGRKFVKKHIPL